MKKLSLVLFIVLLLTNNLVFAAGNSFILRKSDNLPQDELNLITAQTDEVINKQNAGALDPFDNTQPQVFTVYGWFNPLDNGSETSTNAIITGGETRAMIGNPNSGNTLETIKMFSKNKNLALKYSVQLEGENWQGEQTGLYDLAQGAGNMNETSKKIVNLKIKLAGILSGYYDIYYRVHLKGKGWSSWANNNNTVVPEDSVDTFESLDIRILPKGSKVPPDNVDSQEVPLLLATSHIANLGTSKTTIGKNILIGQENSNQGVEGITLTTNNPDLTVSYKSFIKNIGWQESKSNNAFSGTQGAGTPIEAIKLKLEGPQASNYDIYYRTYTQGYGWFDWANNDQISGTINQDLKIEAIQIRILPKGSLLPGNSEFTSVVAYSREEGEFIRNLNTARHEKGLLPVTSNPQLNLACQARSNELKANYNHVRPNQQGYETILNDINYRPDGLKPASGECYTKANDITTAMNNLSKRQICKNLLFTDYYKFCSVITNSNNPTEEQLTTVLFTDTPSDYSYLY